MQTYNMYSDELMEMYLEKYGRLDLETPSVLRAKIDGDFREALVVMNEKLIWHSIHKYVGSVETILKKFGIPKDDLYQSGIIGFVKAIDAFDASLGYKFTSFAIPAVFREVRNYLRNNSSLIKPTKSGYELIHRLRRITDNADGTMTAQELADETGSSLESVQRALSMLNGVKYLDEFYSNLEGDNDFDYREHFAAEGDETERVVTDNLNSLYMADVLRENLNDVEWDIINCRSNGYDIGATCSKLGVSRKTVKNALTRAAAIMDGDYISRKPYMPLIKEIASRINQYGDKTSTSEVFAIIKEKYPKMSEDIRNFIVAESIRYLDTMGERLDNHYTTRLIATYLFHHPAATTQEMKAYLSQELAIDIINNEKMFAVLQKAIIFLNEYDDLDWDISA